MSIIFSVGQYGGFYVHTGYAFRLTIAWLSITILPSDIDNVFEHLPDYPDEN